MKGAFIHETATVEKEARIGSGTRVWHYAHVREGARIGKDCTVGHCAYVGKDVRVGDNVKIENKVSIFKGAMIEDDVFIGPHVAFTNDLRPRAKNDDWEVIETRVKKGASIGVNSTIICGITIGSHSMVGGGSVVTSDVPDHGLVYGNPAKLRGFICSCGEVLGRGKKSGSAFVLKCGECGRECRVPAGVYDGLK
jgi:UDP-2-acetamido-3-amino-2,3-dideoxy-glucuronate N-acetyltransferase